jgi:hypothetical protein
MLGVSVRKVKAETVTLTSKSRWNVTCFVYSVYTINSKVFFKQNFLFLRGLLRFG